MRNSKVVKLRILAALLLASACARTPPPVTPIDVFRDTAAQIASQTNVTADRMAGDWIIRQRFAAAPVGPTGLLTIRTLPNNALQASMTIGSCIQRVCSVSERLVLLGPSGPGRWRAVDPPAFWPKGELWVMWMEFDSRTAAIGTPSGEFGWIMDKQAQGGGDRIAAARDIMDWFGYNIAQLQ